MVKFNQYNNGSVFMLECFGIWWKPFLDIGLYFLNVGK